MQQPIGIIGLGLMGVALAERLGSQGHSILGYDTDPARRHFLTNPSLAEIRASPANSVAAVAEACNTILLSLPTTANVDFVIEQIDQELKPGKCVIDTTTGDPRGTAELGEMLSRRGVEYLDAKLAGSSVETRTGQAIAILGGPEQTVQRCKELIDRVASRSFHVGTWGQGAAMKLVLNLVLGVNRAVLGEALVLARKAQLEPIQALDVLRAGPSYSRVMDLNGPRMLSGDFSAPAAKLSQHLKDVGLILALGEQCSADLPLSRQHEALLTKLMTAGYSDADNSAVIKAFG